MKLVTQPEIIKAELNRIKRYQSAVAKFGYRPYVTVRKSNTQGLAHIIYSHKTNRTHHLLSLGELSVFLHLEHDSCVLAINEQFPLQLDETLKCAELLNIRHPALYKKRSGKTIPATTMTTDFLVEKKMDKGKGVKFYAYNYKPANALSIEHESAQKVSRTHQKFIIEKAYWEKNGISLIQLTNKDFNAAKTYNLQWLRECFDHQNELDVSEDLYYSFLNTLHINVISESQETLKSHLQFCATTLNISLFQCQVLFQYACYKLDFSIDLYNKIELYRTVMMKETCHAH